MGDIESRRKNERSRYNGIGACVVESEFSPPSKKARHDGRLIKNTTATHVLRDLARGLLKHILKNHAWNTHNESPTMYLNVGQICLTYPKEQITLIKIEELYLKTIPKLLEIRFR